MRRALVLILLFGCSAPIDRVETDPRPTELGTAPPTPKPSPPPALRNPVDLPDGQLALAALQILGANVPGTTAQTCTQCHSLTRQQIRYWRALSDTTMSACLTDLAVSSPESAQAMIDCLRAIPSLPESDFLTTKLGIYASAVRLAWFDYTAKYGYGKDTGQQIVDELITSVGMPHGGSGVDITPLRQEQFDVVAEYFVRGLPQLDSTLPPDPAPSSCVLAVSGEVGAHVAAMQTQGWRALNASSMMAMFGCGAETDPRQCLQSTPFGSAQTYGAGWDIPGRGRLRVLADETYSSSYWTRSSPDGRFIGHGVQNVSGSYVIDLQRNGRLIPIATQYDPGWFPDNSGFVFQGGSRNTCGQSVLTSNPSQITMTEPQCTNLTTVGLYQHVGALAGGDHFAVRSGFVSDDGGHSVTLRDPFASFSSSATLTFIPLMFDGVKFAAKPTVVRPTPFEGDTVISPSAKVVITRVAGPGSVQLGYVLRKVVATPAGASYTIEVPEIGRYCLSGGKPAFSYDERWLVYHHYVTPTDADAIELGFTGASDPGFQPYKTQGAANVYLLELATGVTRRIATMQPGQYALYPHFRSDGWIYHAIRDRRTGHEYMVASDAALIAEQQ